MQKVTYDQLNQNQKSNPNAQIINVLSKEDFAKSSITGSKNVPFKDNANFAAETEKTTGSKDRPVTLYCASSECNASSEAAKALETAGFTKVSVYEGGQKEWSEKNTSATKAA